MSGLVIRDIKISRNSRPFVIAEMSGNHNKSLERALEITEMAAKCGASAIKLQTYTPDTMTLDVSGGDFKINNNKLWSGQNLHDLYQTAHTPWKWHEAILTRARECGILCFSTPFDVTAVDFLESLNVPAYKISSFENSHYPLIKKVAKTGKPLLISTGMATLEEIDEMVNIVRNNGCNQLILLKCTSNYPSNPIDSNLRTIPNMRELFKCEVGLSDHTMGIGAAIASISHGATVIEKHFTIRRSDGGVDSAFSMEPSEFKQLVVESNRAWEAQGFVHYGTTNAEINSKIFKRSVYIAKDINKGQVLDSNNIKIVRPGMGLAPKHYEEILGKRINKDCKKGDAVTWDLINP
jgi:N-acetylneuraminate synthase